MISIYFNPTESNSPGGVFHGKTQDMDGLPLWDPSLRWGTTVTGPKASVAFLMWALQGPVAWWMWRRSKPRRWAKRRRVDQEIGFASLNITIKELFEAKHTKNYGDLW